MNQVELRRMARERILDAQALLYGGRWAFAYYASGYAVECALKSCVLARMIHTAWIFGDKWKSQDFLTHDFGKLIKLAGLTDELNAHLTASAASGGNFVAHWTTVNQWQVDDRYYPRTESDARALYAAIIDTPHGVLPWIQNYW